MAYRRKCAHQIIQLLRDRGFDVADVRERGFEGSPDSLVIEIARSEGRILVTTDRDFSNILVYPPETHHGIVVLRMSQPRGAGFVKLFKAFIDSFDLGSLPEAITIVTENKVRQRRRPSL